MICKYEEAKVFHLFHNLYYIISTVVCQLFVQEKEKKLEKNEKSPFIVNNSPRAFALVNLEQSWVLLLVTFYNE